MRLSALLGVPYHVVRQRIQDATAGAQSQRVVASDVRLRDAAFISEHSDAFPGVAVQERTVRDYPYGALAAHVLGYTGAVTADDLAVGGRRARHRARATRWAARAWRPSTTTFWRATTASARWWPTPTATWWRW